MSAAKDPPSPILAGGPFTPEAVEAIIRRGPLEAQQRLPIALSMDPPDDVDVESVCLRLAGHPDSRVRGNALLGLGHLARVLGRLEPTRVKPVLRAALNDDDPQVCSRAADAISDIHTFLGWTFRHTRPRARPEAPREFVTMAAWRAWLIIDESSRILVERGPPDPRGLSPGDVWRLPGHSLTRSPANRARRLEAMWRARRDRPWINESNLFDGLAVVQTRVLEGGEDNAFLEWVQLRPRAWLTAAADSPWPAAKGVEQDWLGLADFMSEAPVGAHDRFALSLFNDFYLQQTGAWFF